MSLFTSDWAVALNVYFLIGFPIVAVAAVWFLRTCGVSRAMTVALATLFAIAPYHFQRGENHLWLASYYTVPLALGLLVLILQRQPLWGGGRSANPFLRWLLSPTARTVLWIALLATSSSYYAVFFLVLLAFTGVAVLIRDRKRPFLGAVGAGVLTAVVMLVNMAPDLLFRLEEGTNPGLERGRGEAELYALKLAQLLLPWAGSPHRCTPRAPRRVRPTTRQREQPALGAIAAVGLVSAFLILALALFAFLKREAGSSPQFTASWPLLLAVFGVLFGTVGGLSTIVSFFTSSLRGWNRIVDRHGDALPRGGRPARRLIPTTASLGGLDSVTHACDRRSAQPSRSSPWDSSTRRPPPPPTTRRQGAVRRGCRVVRARSNHDAPDGPGARAPVHPFPESFTDADSSHRSSSSRTCTPDEIRWSNGGIKGRPAGDWPGELTSDEPEPRGTRRDGRVLRCARREAGVRAMTDGRSRRPSPRRHRPGAHRVSANEAYAFYDIESVVERIERTSTTRSEARARADHGTGHRVPGARLRTASAWSTGRA